MRNQSTQPNSKNTFHFALYEGHFPIIYNWDPAALPLKLWHILRILAPAVKCKGVISVHYRADRFIIEQFG